MTRLDKDPPQASSTYANTADIAKGDRALLETPIERVTTTESGREGSVEDLEIQEKSVGSRPVSDRTDFRLSGTGAIETNDGLDETSEMMRRATEDTTDDEPSDAESDTPVFDRGERI